MNELTSAVTLAASTRGAAAVVQSVMMTGSGPESVQACPNCSY